LISLTSDEGGTRRTWGKYTGTSTRQAAAPARLHPRSTLRRRRLRVSLTFADEVCSTLRWSKQDSTLVSRETASYMSSLMGPRAPVVEMPEARHHVMLDQPLGFVAALRMLLDMRNESAEGSGPLRATRDN
jgi:pimeloyl-ACP methyl ester carboxylesterase